MKLKNTKLVVVCALLALVIVNACRHEFPFPTVGAGGGGGGGGGGNPPPVSTCSADTAYFVKDVMPIISSNCTMSGCHDNITHAEGVDLTTYTKILRYVVAGNAGSSKLYKSIIKTNGDRMPPPPNLPLSAVQKALIQKWINQGARNNNCTGNCDTATFTYGAAVKIIIENKCLGCHNPSNLGGNINLATYDAVRLVALNGKLYGSVAQQQGYSPMPKNGIKLSDCEIRQIQKWISAGSLNN